MRDIDLVTLARVLPVQRLWREGRGRRAVAWIASCVLKVASGSGDDLLPLPFSSFGIPTAAGSQCIPVQPVH